MSTTIENRVVEMEFDNKKFERNVSTTMTTLDKLKQKLSFTGASKGLEELDSASKKVNMSTLSNGVDTIRTKFSALEVMAVTALANITNSAVNAGKRIAASLTIDPIKSGFSEYETQINAVQTILANTESKGKTLEDVNGALDELNKYADKTIYNFTEMTRNIGTFTAAGVDLDTSVAAIKGIANLAAVSGSTSQQASTAMYQLSQALASGTVKLMDWNSVVNAGMGGQVFQDALTETARVHGIAIDDMIKKQGSFRETLSEGWLSSEILTETLSKFTGDLSKEQLKTLGYTDKQIEAIVKMGQTANDAATKVKTFTQLFDTLKEAAQSGWTQSWEILVGDFEEAKETLTEASDVIGAMIGASAEARNIMLQGWKDLGGREALIESIRNAFEGIASIIKPIKEAFREIFPPTTSEQLYSLTEGLKAFTEKIKISDETSDNLKRTFKGLFAIVDIVVNAIGSFLKAIGNIIGYISPAGEGLLSFTAKIGDFLVGLDDTVKATDIFNKAFEKLGDIIEPIAEGIVVAIDLIVESFKSLFTMDFAPLDDISNNVKDRLGPIGGIASFTSTVFSGIVKTLKKTLPALSNLGSGIADVFGDLMDAIAGADYDKAWDIVNGGILGAIAIGIKKFITSVSGLTDSAGDFLGSITGILDGVKDCFGAWQESIKAGALLKIAGAIAILAASLVVLTLLDSAKLAAALATITTLFIELTGALSAISKTTGPIKSVGKLVTVMIGLSTAILILSSAVKKMASLGWDGLIKGLVGVVALSKVLTSSANSLSSNSERILKGSTNLIIFAAAIRVLVESVEALGVLDVESLIKGLVGVGALCAGLVVFLKTANLDKLSLSNGLGMITLATGIRILASSVKVFGSMNIEALIQGLLAVGTLLAEIAIFLKFTKDADKVISTAIGLTILGAAMLIMSEAVEKLGSLNWDQLIKGLVAIGGALASITIAMKFLPDNPISKATGILVVSTAMIILSKAVENMGNLSLEQIGKGLLTMAVGLVEIVAALRLMPNSIGSKAIGLTGVALALTILAPVLKKLGSMPFEDIVKGLVALAGVFAVLGVAGHVLAPLTPAILGLSAAILLLGVGCAAVGVGVLALSAGLSALALSGTAAAASIVAIVTGIFSLIPMLFEMIGKGIVSLASVITEGAPAIAEALIALITSTVDMLVVCVPDLVDGILDILMLVLDSLKTKIQPLVESLADVLIGLIDGLTAKMPALIQSGVNLLVSFIQGLCDAMGGYEPENLLKMIAGIAAIVGCFALLAAAASTVKKSLVTVGIMGLVLAGITGMFVLLTSLGLESVISVAASLSTLLLSLSATMAIISVIPVSGALTGIAGLAVVIAGLTAIVAAIGGIAQIPGFDWIISEGAKALAGIGDAIGGFVGSIVGGFLGGVSSGFPEIGANLSLFMTNAQPFIDGVKNIDNSAMVGVKALAETVLILTAANLLEGLTSWLTGESSMVDFGKEISEFAPYFVDYYNTIKDVDGSVVQASANAAKALAEMANNLPNQGGVVGWFMGENNLSDFAKELEVFGPSLKAYADSVAGVDGSVVEASANAAKSLAEMANNLPNQGGVVGWFTGENNLSDFAEELVVFGPKLKKYAYSVKGIDGDVVVNSALAATALAEMAHKLPNQGGVVGWFKGENNLSDFAEELAVFGPKLKAYALSVAGLDANVVINSANAAQAVSELAHNLPNSGGVASWFTGDNDIGDFGKSLIVFGEHFAKYSSYMKTVDAGIVTSTANAASSIVELQKSLPKEGGWFSDDATLSDFGTDMSAFGSKFATYYANISTINTTQLSGVTEELDDIVAMAKGLKDLDTDKIGSFATQLTKLGKAGIDGFIKAFTDAYGKVEDTADDMIDSFIAGADAKISTLKTAFSSIADHIVKTLNGKQTNFDSVGGSLINSLKNGADKKTTTVVATMTDIMTKSIAAIEKKRSNFTSKASDIIHSFISGIQNKSNSIYTKFTSVADNAVLAIKNKQFSFYYIASHLVDGFVNGISANTYKAAAQAAAMASAAAEAAKRALDEHSPSKVFYKIGDNAGVGFVNALLDSVSSSRNAGSDMANAATDGLTRSLASISQIINSDIDTTPTIRPVVDLTDVKNGSRTVSRLFGRRLTTVGVGLDVGSIEANTSRLAHIMTQTQEKRNNDDIIDAIEFLREDVTGLGEVISKMKVVMDTGETVGSLENEIDRRLGVRAIRKGRRV